MTITLDTLRFRSCLKGAASCGAGRTAVIALLALLMTRRDAVVVGVLEACG